MIAGIFGNVGKLKTSLATLVAYCYASNNVPVYANYDLDFNNSHRLEIEDLLNLDVQRGLILVDEVYTVAESRISTSKLNRFFSYFIFQSRKLHVDIVYTSQLTSAVDLRLFNLTDKKIACFGFNKDKTSGRFQLVYENNGKQKKRRFSIPIEVFKKYVFNHFDTYQPVDPLGIKDLIIDVIKFDYTKLNARIQESITKLSAVYPELINQNVKKYEINDALLRINEPVSLAPYVCDRLRSRISTKKTLQKKKAFPKWWDTKSQLMEKSQRI